jgi:hypothetical protein
MNARELEGKPFTRVLCELQLQLEVLDLFMWRRACGDDLNVSLLCHCGFRL